MFDFDELDEAEDEPPSEAPAQSTDDAEAEALGKEIAAEAMVADDQGDLLAWCMKYKVIGFPLPAGQCRFRVFCFHNAGSAESVWTTGSRNPLLAWVKETKAVELVAVSYPGRDKLRGSKPIESAALLARTMLPVVHSKLTDGVPFVLWGHSVGTWVAYELLLLLRRLRLPLPRAAFLNGFAGPQLPQEQRPWRRSSTLDTAALGEEIKAWDRGHFEGAAKMIFQEPDWSKTWLPLMRADFKLFDEYPPRPAETLARFSFPIHSYHFAGEHFITPDMVQLWSAWTSNEFDFEIFPGMGHLTSLYIPEHREVYFGKVVALLKKYAAL